MAGEFIDEGYGSAPNSPMMSPQGGGAVDPLGLGIGGSPYGLGGYGGGFGSPYGLGGYGGGFGSPYGYGGPAGIYGNGGYGFGNSVSSLGSTSGNTTPEDVSSAKNDYAWGDVNRVDQLHDDGWENRLKDQAFTGTEMGIGAVAGVAIGAAMGGLGAYMFRKPPVEGGQYANKRHWWGGKQHYTANDVKNLQRATDGQGNYKMNGHKPVYLDKGGNEVYVGSAKKKSALKPMSRGVGKFAAVGALLGGALGVGGAAMFGSSS